MEYQTSHLLSPLCGIKTNKDCAFSERLRLFSLGWLFTHSTELTIDKSLPGRYSCVSEAHQTQGKQVKALRVKSARRP